MTIIAFLFIFLGLIVRNFHLAQILFYDWDEGIYAQVAQEIIKNKTLFTTFNGQPYFHIPPLLHSLIAFVFMLFGRSEFWARMSMIVVAFMLLILTYKAAKKIFLILSPNDKPQQVMLGSLIPVLILAASPIFIERSALINSDTLIAVSWIGYLLYRDSFWKKLFFLTLGVWSKSVLGFYPVLFDIFIWIFQKKKITVSKIRRYIIFITIPSLWYIAELIKYGNVFIYNHFLSQVLKRITVPIELHFGGKFFYLSFLWDKMGVINVLFIISYVFYGIYLIQALVKDRLCFFSKNNIFVFLFMIAPFPFFAFLTVMKTKIYWYVIMFLPFLCISLTYLYVSLKNKLLRIVFLIGIVVYFLVSFIPQTYLMKLNYVKPDKLKLAQCIAPKSYNKLAFLVDIEERKIKNFLEAAHYDTSISFYWGGSPSFVFYVKKKVDYFYNVDEFIKRAGDYHILVASKNDIKNSIPIQSLFTKKAVICDFGDWLSIVK